MIRWMFYFANHMQSFKVKCLTCYISMDTSTQKLPPPRTQTFYGQFILIIKQLKQCMYHGNRLETGAGAERKRGGGGRRDSNSHCRDGDNDADDGVIGFRNGIGGGGGGGVTGSQWLQWGGVEWDGGGGVKVIHLLPKTRDTWDYLPK